MSWKVAYCSVKYCNTAFYKSQVNLSFLSKLLERVVQTRLQWFLDSNNMLPSTQSAYRQFHSTETAVTTIYNDMLLAADNGHVSALCLLDLTAAFDTVDHDLLLLRLEQQFGLRSVVLRWLQSYLADRSFRVIYCNETSSIYCFHSVLCSARVRTRSASFYSVHGGPCRRSTAAPCKHPRVC